MINSNVKEIERLHTERKDRQKALTFALEMGDTFAVSALMRDCSAIEIAISKLHREV
jgi:hypothetical protein